MPLTCSVFIATSSDGFIARADDNIDWLDDPAYTMLATEDFGYAEFTGSIDTLVMGRRSFEKVLTFSNWPYDDLPVVVLSSRTIHIPAELQTKVRCMHLEPHELVAQLEAEGLQHLYIDGGETIRRFLRAGLIADMTITRLPVLLGEGIQLFGTIDHDIRLSHDWTRTFGNGFVQTKYRIVREA
ncbi:dihydrofolate reductase family protein [Symmachiella dynata]|uniref:dihydrofolate reductase family protein n=1 Tax=Symmachiella dynata TaxID=2527995 RepID=UPI0030EBFD06